MRVENIFSGICSDCSYSAFIYKTFKKDNRNLYSNRVDTGNRINFIKCYNPAILRILLDNDTMEYYLSGNGYTNSGDLNRLTAVQKLYSMFSEETELHSCLALVLGSCDYS